MSHAPPLHDRGSLADTMRLMPRCALPGHVHEEGSHQVQRRARAAVQWPREQAVDEAGRA